MPHYTWYVEINFVIIIFKNQESQGILNPNPIGVVLCIFIYFYLKLPLKNYIFKDESQVQVKLSFSYFLEATFNIKVAISFVTITYYLHIRFYLYLLFYEVFTSKIRSLIEKWGNNSFKYWKYWIFLILKLKSAICNQFIIAAKGF